MTTPQEYDKLSDDYDRLYRLYAEQQGQQPRPTKHGFMWHAMNWLALLSIAGLLIMTALTVGPDILVSYGLVPKETMCAWFEVECADAPAAGSKQPGGTQPGGGPSGGSAPIVNVAPLPPCSSVGDTRTACTGSSAPAQPQAEQVAPTPIWCEDVLAGSGISTCQWRDADAARQLQEQTAREAVQLWTDMADQAVEEDLRAPATTPTAQVPTECQAPPNDRARAACELIKRGIIHPKG